MSSKPNAFSKHKEGKDVIRRENQFDTLIFILFDIVQNWFKII